MGLSLENFDGAGQFRTTEKGAAIDASGVLDGVKFDNATGMAKALHDNPATVSCLVNRVFAYGMGRVPTRADKDLVTYFQSSFVRDGYRVKGLMRTLATSRGFSQVDGGDQLAELTRK